MLKRCFDATTEQFANLKKENERLRLLVWKSNPNNYRKLPKEVHKIIMSFLDQRSWDVLQVHCGEIYNCYKRNETYEINQIYTRTIIKGLTLDDMCDLLSEYTYLCWTNTGCRMLKISLKDALLQVGIKKYEPIKSQTITKNNIVKDRIQKKITKLKTKPYITFSKKPKLQPNLFLK